MNHRIRACMVFAWIMWQAPALSQVYDCTVSGELADVKGVVRWEGVYHLWNLHPGGMAAAWKPAFERVAKGENVWLNIEPDVSPNKDWRKPVDPSLAKPAEVRETFAAIAEQLVPLCEDAQRTGAEVWTYRLFSPTYRRGESIVNDPRQWQRNCRSLARIEDDGVRLSELVDATGGGELFEVYVPGQWNRSESWALAKCLLLYERQASELDRNGIRGIPLFSFYTVGEKAKPVRTEIMQALIFAGKARGRVAVWNGWIEGKSEFPAITKEQKAMLRQ